MRKENAILKCNENLRELYYCRLFLKDNIFEKLSPYERWTKKNKTKTI